MNWKNIWEIKLIKYTLTLFALIVTSLNAQPKWKAKNNNTELQLELFHSTQLASLPTTESLKKNSWMYEISHRFSTPIKEGSKHLWGFDGPAKIRFAIGYGISDNLMINIGRTNNLDNYDIQIKQRLFQINNSSFPSLISVLGGLAINTDMPQNIDRNSFDTDNMQFYAQLIFNTMLFDKKLGIGIVPSYLYNSFTFAVEKQYSFTIGSYAQYYFNRMYSVWVEYNAIITGYQGIIKLDEIGKSYNNLSFGVSLETGGHIFELMITNSTRINPSQYIVGADKSSSDNKWNFGFGIIRFF